MPFVNYNPATVWHICHPECRRCWRLLCHRRIKEKERTIIRARRKKKYRKKEKTEKEKRRKKNEKLETPIINYEQKRHEEKKMFGRIFSHFGIGKRMKTNK